MKPFKPAACSCGSPDVLMYSISGNLSCNPADYCYECRNCHSIRTKPVKYPGRPKGSKNKKTIAREKKLDWWGKMCADAEKELYGSNHADKNNI